MPNPKAPHYRQLLRGFFRRERFLRAWTGLVKEKLQKLRNAVNRPQAWENNDGHRVLVAFQSAISSNSSSVQT